MIDLYSEDSVINHYADRYRNYMPVNVRKVIRSSIDDSNSSHVWDETLPLITMKMFHAIKHLGR